MKKVLLALLGFAPLAAFAEDGFLPLFNGKNLDGWDGDPRLWSVRGRNDRGLDRRRPARAQRIPDQQEVVRQFHPARRHASCAITTAASSFAARHCPSGWCAATRPTWPPDNYWGCIYEEKGKRGVMVNGWEKG